MPLKGIPAILSPELLCVLARMGHGDEIGLSIPSLLEAILQLLPLDTYVDYPVALMKQVAKDMNTPVPIWEDYKAILQKAEGKRIHLGFEERFPFYERAKAAFAVVHTGELAQYGNIILKKGLVI